MGLNDNGPSIPRIQVFRPTFEEMKDFEGYINKIERDGAHKAGLAKIIPPPEWKPRRDMNYESDEIDQVTIKAPIQQIVQGRLGMYQQYNIQKKALTVKEFKKLAESPRYRTPDYFDYDELERKYWKNVAYNPPIYGADVPGTLYDEDVDEFNINRLDTILDLVNESYGIKIMGVNTAYLYFGMWKTTFAWHTEDMDLYSINYLHFGAPKSWYCVPPEHGKRLERLAAGFFPNSETACPAFLRHKMTLISPLVLKQYSIPYNKITQEAGEFMVTFPFSYHAGYNHGYNCAESTNFATERWVEYGKRATRCNCRSDSVKISMEAFVKKYQPDRYDLWLQGKDVGPHPEDPTHISPAPLPSDYELQVLSKVSKSKRHPPYKPEPEISDTDSMDNGCETSNHFPTKAARKHFETTANTPSSSSSSQSKPIVGNSITIGKTEYLKTSPPDIKETVKRIRNRFAGKGGTIKRVRKGSSSLETTPANSINRPSNTRRLQKLPNEASGRNLCSQSPESSIPLTWVPKSSQPDPGALELIDNFLECDIGTTNQTLMDSNKSDCINPKDGTLNSITYPPPPLLLIDPSQRRSSSSSSPSSQQYYASTSIEVFSTSHLSPRSHHLPPLPPLQPQHRSPSSNQLNGYCSGLESDCNRDTSVEITEALIELPSPQANNNIAEAGTSTEDLLVNDIILESKTVHSDDLSKLLADATLSHDLRQILKRLPVQPYLYQHLPYNFFGEQIFNCSMSSIYPHCSICITMRKFEIKDDWVDEQSRIPTSSPIMIPSAAFAFKVDDATTNLEEVKVSPLLVCSDCKICVHSICYGVVNKLDLDNRALWKCDRCINKDYGAHCCLCPLRGGALKKTQDENKWAHITCALMQPGVTFKNGINKQPIDISGIKKNRANSPNFKCIYCQKTNNKLADYMNGFCIQCYMAPRCAAKFHTTCAHVNGAKFTMDDWPDPIRVYCTKCIDKSSTKESLTHVSTDDVDIGTIVLAKHKNGRYYDANVIDKTSMILHHAHLEDNSFLQVIRSSDIVDPDIEKTGIPEVGDSITIYWDKINQMGKYAGNHTTHQYSLKFEDGSIVKSTRETFYRLEQEIPAKVQAKRSRATDVRHDNSFWQNNLKILTAAQ